jgi:hypothetical protein
MTRVGSQRPKKKRKKKYIYIYTHTHTHIYIYIYITIYIYMVISLSMHHNFRAMAFKSTYLVANILNYQFIFLFILSDCWIFELNLYQNSLIKVTFRG